MKSTVMSSFNSTTWLPYLSAIGMASAAAIVQSVSYNSIDKRSVQLGWSLQANSCPAGDTFCSGGACCPSSLYCIAAANDEVAACCTTSKYPICKI